MLTRTHVLTAASPGTRRELTSLHFGTAASGPKAYVQASLHADEVPAMLVAHHLRQRLQQLETQGRVLGEIVLLPAANPVGLSQRLLQQPFGRFELGSGENFNRHYPDLVAAVADEVEGQLTGDAAANIATVRRALRSACAALPATTELQSLRRQLLTLAVDADTLIDLHCDNEAVLHLYTTTPLWPQVAPLAAALGAPLTLLATRSGDEPFDEACSMIWSRLSEALAERDPDADALPEACVAMTVELRGEADVQHDTARNDAEALLHYLAWRGHLRLDAGHDRDQAGANPLTKDNHRAARPLAGSMPVVAPHAGVWVPVARLGDEVRAGQPVAELIDPVSGKASVLRSPVAGLLYARDNRRFVQAGQRVAKVAGHQALRQGKLLSA